MRPLPKDQDWTAYVYLFYLVYYLVVGLVFPIGPWGREATVAATVAAVGLYFWGYWLRGLRRFWVVGGFLVLGTLCANSNPGSSVFFVYGASFIGKAIDPPRAYWALGGLLAIIGLEAWLLHLSPWLWTAALGFSVLVGMLVIHEVQRRRLNNSLLRAQEEVERLAATAERERIGRDLHDLLGHTLSLIVLKSELASRLAEKDPARAACEIRDVERISREALSQVRAAVRGYHSVGLEAELTHAREALAAAGITFDSKVEPVTVSASQESVLTLAIREGITNVVRHAGAKTCQLALRCRYFGCELEIADDGRGGSAPDGFGLGGMRERVEALGGTLERDGSNGMRLILRLPTPGASGVTE